MKSYVFRYKKLMDRTPNNYRKMHGKPMKRWVQLRKLYDARATRNDENFRRAIASIINISEALFFFMKLKKVFSDTDFCIAHPKSVVIYEFFNCARV